MCGLVIEKNFSVVHRLHHFVIFVYGFDSAKIFQAIVNSLPSSFPECWKLKEQRHGV